MNSADAPGGCPVSAQGRRWGPDSSIPLHSPVRSAVLATPSLPLGPAITTFTLRGGITRLECHVSPITLVLARVESIIRLSQDSAEPPTREESVHRATPSGKGQPAQRDCSQARANTGSNGHAFTPVQAASHLPPSPCPQIRQPPTTLQPLVQCWARVLGFGAEDG